MLIVAIISILVFLALCWLAVFLLLKAINKLSTSIENHIIEKEKVRQQRVKEIIDELFTRKAERKKEVNENPFISAHHKFKADREKAKNIRQNIKSGYENLEQKHKEYLDWCEQNEEIPTQKKATERIDNFHLS